MGIDDPIARLPRPVGRDVEIRRVLDGVERHGASFLRGPAGIGKSLVLHEVAVQLRARGTEVIALSGTEATAVIPLAPLLRLCPPGAEDAGAAIMAELYRRSRQTRTVVLVDDAHLLDPATAAVVRQMAAAPAVGVAVAVRSGEPLPASIESIHRDGYATVLELAELDRRASRHLVEQLLGATEDEALEWIWTRTRGHPLYLRELVAAGRQTGALQQRDGRWHAIDAPVWTARLHTLVATRLRGLARPERRAMELVAVGGTVPLGALRDIVDLDVVVELVERRLLALDAGQVRVDHPLIGETLLATVPPERTTSARLRLANALEAHPEDRAPVAVAQLRLDAGQAVGPELLLEALDVALSSRLPQVAERLARVACEATPDPSARMRLVESLAMQRRWEEAEEHFERVREACDAQAAVHHLERWLLLNFEYRDDLAVGRRIAAEAHQQIGGRATEGWQALLLRIEQFTGELDASIAAHEQWLATVDAPAPLRERMLVDIATCASHSGAFGLVGDARRAVSGLDGAGDPVELARLDGVHLVALAWTEGMPTLAADIDRFLAAAVAGGDADVELLAHLHAGMACNDLTRYAQAVAHLTTVMELGQYARHRRHVPLALAELGRALLGTRRGPREALAWLDRARALPIEVQWVSGPVVQLGTSILDAAAGRDPWPALEQGLDHARRRSARIHEVTLLREMAQLGRAPDVVTRLGELAGLMGGGLTHLVAREAEALATGDATALDVVAVDAAAFGAVGLAADASAHASTLHATAGRTGAAFASLYRCDATLRAAPGQRSRVRELVVPILSSREREVVDAVADGASNREVAERLYISHRTVESHLRRIYRRLEVSGRDELLSLLSPGAPSPPHGARRGSLIARPADA